jgi:hypothetical protein
MGRDGSLSKQDWFGSRDTHGTKHRIRQKITQRNVLEHGIKKKNYTAYGVEAIFG